MGTILGDWEGVVVGAGDMVGAGVTEVGVWLFVGNKVGTLEGERDGSRVGTRLGCMLGRSDGCCVTGALVGLSVGCGVTGAWVGFLVGASVVGALVGGSVGATGLSVGGGGGGGGGGATGAFVGEGTGAGVGAIGAVGSLKKGTSPSCACTSVTSMIPKTKILPNRNEDDVDPVDDKIKAAAEPSNEGMHILLRLVFVVCCCFFLLLTLIAYAAVVLESLLSL